MAFDPLSWAIGFGASRATLKLYDSMYGPSLKRRLAKAAKEWAGKLPAELYTIPEAILDTDDAGPAREKLQVRLFLRGEVPTADVWLGALAEAWQSRKNELGGLANGFFLQSKESAAHHLNDLANALYLACSKESDLFQVSALQQLAGLSFQAEEILTSVHTSRSEILDKIDEISGEPLQISQKAICQLLEAPHVWHLDGLMSLNSLLLVDEPSTVVSGRIRKSVAWVGDKGSPIKDATYLPPRPEQLCNLLERMADDWSENSSPFESRNVGNKVAAVAKFHHDLVSVHPFEDGNGRVARALTDYQVMHHFDHHEPLKLIEDAQYVEVLRAADNNNITPFAELIATRLLRSNK